MAQAENNDLTPIFDLVLAFVKDVVSEDVYWSLQAIQRAYLEAEVDTRRAKATAINRAIAKLDSAKRRLEYAYSCIQRDLPPDPQNPLENVIGRLEQYHADLVYEKNKNHPPPLSEPFSPMFSATAPKRDHELRLTPGDILATGRADGLYQHFGVYIGDGKVIHYAAEGSDFGGRITIHEAPLSDFCADSEQIYVLDFPDDRGYPTMRTWQGDFAVPDPSEEGPLFRLVRETSYHLYTPEETVARAKSRIGEENYNLVVNNCEHFAIWCKTGISESHQVNVWLTRLFQYAEQYILN